MLYEIFIEGEFQNIRGVSTGQRFSVDLNCTSCGTEHKKSVIVTKDSVKREDDTGKFNLIVACGFCKKKMKLRVLPPRGESLECIDAESGAHCSAELFLGEHRKEGFVVSSLETVGCLVVRMARPSIDVLSDNNVLFRNIDCESDAWAGAFQEGFSSIETLSHRISQVK